MIELESVGPVTEAIYQGIVVRRLDLDRVTREASRAWLQGEILRQDLDWQLGGRRISFLKRR